MRRLFDKYAKGFVTALLNNQLYSSRLERFESKNTTRARDQALLGLVFYGKKYAETGYRLLLDWILEEFEGNLIREYYDRLYEPTGSNNVATTSPISSQPFTFANVENDDDETIQDVSPTNNLMHFKSFAHQLASLVIATDFIFYLRHVCALPKSKIKEKLVGTSSLPTAPWTEKEYWDLMEEMKVEKETLSWAEALLVRKSMYRIANG